MNIEYRFTPAEKAGVPRHDAVLYRTDNFLMMQDGQLYKLPMGNLQDYGNIRNPICLQRYAEEREELLGAWASFCGGNYRDASSEGGGLLHGELRRLASS